MSPFAQRPLSAIAAIADNNVIGNANSLPWRLPEDLRFFKKTTLGHVLIMGRKTYESIGHPLPGREIVVLTRNRAAQPSLSHEALHYAQHWEEIFAIAPGKKLFLAGGAQLYAQALPWCHELFLTHIHKNPEGDAFFPEYTQWFDEGELLEQGANYAIRHHRRKRGE
ncbi:MAG: dihydrofolate reductase [Puniceicoccales bacterium]|jgi:dihydrofolate reductase|nr:dihydrofolate reductase [Puniceicoccales bacterium]